jgi:outer membrane lipoprotein-sorting protein
MALVLLTKVGAGESSDARALLTKAESVASSTTNWRAEVVDRSRVFGQGVDLQDEVHIKIAAQAPLKLRRENSGADRTILVCDGVESFYSGDGHNYYRTDAKVNPDCNYPLSSFYKLSPNPISASIVGDDHVTLADGEHSCDIVRAEWTLHGTHVLRTMCIDPTSGLILREIVENDRAGMRMISTITFTSYELNPEFSPDTFRFSIPAGAVEAKPPI